MPENLILTLLEDHGNKFHSGRHFEEIVILGDSQIGLAIKAEKR
mgnify:CR=1 FL=1|jgi:hypothetical protein